MHGYNHVLKMTIMSIQESPIHGQIKLRSKNGIFEYSRNIYEYFCNSRNNYEYFCNSRGLPSGGVEAYTCQLWHPYWYLAMQTHILPMLNSGSQPRSTTWIITKSHTLFGRSRSVCVTPTSISPHSVVLQSTTLEPRLLQTFAYEHVLKTVNGP